MKKIIRNVIRCKSCGDIIESKYTHDYVTCKCGRCSVDGGHSYLRRSFCDSTDDYEELSELEDENEKIDTKKVKIKFSSLLIYLKCISSTF